MTSERIGKEDSGKNLSKNSQMPRNGGTSSRNWMRERKAHERKARKNVDRLLLRREENSKESKEKLGYRK